jgi:hypothetical protein
MLLHPVGFLVQRNKSLCLGTGSTTRVEEQSNSGEGWTRKSGATSERVLLCRAGWRHLVASNYLILSHAHIELPFATNIIIVFTEGDTGSTSEKKNTQLKNWRIITSNSQDASTLVSVQMLRFPFFCLVKQRCRKEQQLLEFSVP